jgi:uncharacterized protein (DUF2384 family)
MSKFWHLSARWQRQQLRLAPGLLAPFFEKFLGLPAEVLESLHQDVALATLQAAEQEWHLPPRPMHRRQLHRRRQKNKVTDKRNNLG